jgi:lipopolysaccharide transport system permease protein
MTANATLVRKIYFPRETLLLAVMISALVDLAIAAVLLAAMFVYYQVAVSSAVLWVIPLLALQMMFVLAIILITSAVQVYYRDIGHALPLLLQLWMYASPVAYPLSSVPDWLKPIYLINPMAGIIDGYRSALLHGARPNLAYLGTTALALAAVVTAAYLIFKRAERTFADFI